MEETWRQINAVATALLAYTLAAALGGSGFIAAFTAGIVFRLVATDHAKEATFLAEQSGELLSAVTFLLFGAVLLGPMLGELDWRIALYAVASLTLVRMLPVALAMVGTGMRRATVGFLGWFGPRGLASIVFMLILLEETELPERPLMVAAVTWTVALSVYAHGLTAWPATNRYADWYDAHQEHHQVMAESIPVAEQRPRGPALRQQRRPHSLAEVRGEVPGEVTRSRSPSRRLPGPGRTGRVDAPGSDPQRTWDRCLTRRHSRSPRPPGRGTRRDRTDRRPVPGGRWRRWFG